MRAQRWSPERIAREIHELTRSGVPLKYAALGKASPRLLMAIYRHTGSLKAIRVSLGQDDRRTKRMQFTLPGYPGTRQYARRQAALKTICRYVPEVEEPVEKAS